VIVGAKGKNNTTAQIVTLVIHEPVRNKRSAAIGAIIKTPKAKLKYMAPRK